MRFLTLATVDLLPQARVLARSLERQRPDSSLEVLLIDSGAPAARAIEAQEPFRLSSAARELDLDIERLIARHDQQELTALLVPRLLRTYATREPGPLLHVPPSVWFLGGLEPIEAALSTHSVLLTPRMSGDVPEDGLEPTSLRVDRRGRIDEAIIGVDGSADADDFLEWWGAHVEAIVGSLDGGRGARPEDRHWLARYLELAPARFATAVLDEPGFNLSMWNLHEHQLQTMPEGVIVDGRRPLGFLNLPGFDPDRPHRLSALAGRVRVSRSPALRDLCIRYAQELREAGSSDPSLRADVGRRLADGLVYDERLSTLHARARMLGERFDDLFAGTGTQAFIRWLQGPAPAGTDHGINRYVFYTVAGERSDVLRAYPDLDADDGARYVSWCWEFGRRELAIPDRFMPPAPDGHLVSASPSGNERRATRGRAPVGPVADADVAVRVSGYLGHTLGLGAAARGYVRALGAAAVPVSTVSVPLHHLERPQALTDDYGQHRYEDLVHDGSHGFELIAVNADELPGFVARLGEDYFEGPRIGIWGWETNSIPSRWQQAFALIDEIWVYSRFMAENIGAVAPVPVIALPPPVQRPRNPAAPQRLGVPDGFLFVFVFDYLSTVQRKNPVGLVEAFMRAFKPGEGPQLLIKTINAPLRPLAEEEVLWAAHGRPDIHLIDRSLSAEDLDGLMAACDCYVSLHRAEGFGLTMAEAMAIGKPVIATGYSGNVDFMNAENSYLVEYDIGRVGAENEIYPPDGEWAQPSVEHAAELMRWVVAGPEEAARIGARAAQDVASTLSPQATGAAMRSRLEELTAVQGARPAAPRRA